MSFVATAVGRKHRMFKNAVRVLVSRAAGTVPVEAQFRTKAYRLHLLESGPSTLVNLTRDDALKFYRQMTLIRYMEEEIDKLYSEEYIRGVCHNCIGQEALSIGVEGAIEPEDLVMGGYRNHGWVYTRGLSVLEIIAELLGRKTGCAKGKGGSMHLQTPNFLCTGILGSQVSVGTGFAFALKYQKANNVALAVYGDGAANQGQVYESFNMAKLWDLPVIYICENNQFAMSTPVSRASALNDFHNRVNFLPGIQAVDLNAEEEVRRGIEAAKSDPVPHTRDAFTDVYFHPPIEYKVRGCDPWTMHDDM
ncbi:pyruvate dehydrogenase E1 component subunit alpha, somatic form, mitochondrial-like isoform X2 [Ptychodera flava]|uniref:pyruvate dehydrogenase E1 component subunit alpha, somatic form, mitochondrial-like isoform X2 n=1 Tax=Ptychodera flava TaxID=63121 RepID=UPI00396A4B32